MGTYSISLIVVNFKKSQVISSSINFIQDYRSCFHLKSHLQREMIDFYHHHKRIMQSLLQFDSSHVTTTLKDAPFDFDGAEATISSRLQELKDEFQEKFHYSSLFELEPVKIKEWLSLKVRTHVSSSDELAHFLPAMRGIINSAGEFLLLVDSI